MHRGSMVEIIVPYGDPRHPFQHKCAFDVMDYGLGFTANSLELGCDCLGHIKYFDGMVNNSKGMPLAECILQCHSTYSDGMVTSLQGAPSAANVSCLPDTKSSNGLVNNCKSMSSVSSVQSSAFTSVTLVAWAIFQGKMFCRNCSWCVSASFHMLASVHAYQTACRAQ